MLRTKNEKSEAYVVAAMKAQIRMIRSLLSTYMESRAINQDVGHIPLPQDLQNCRIDFFSALA